MYILQIYFLNNVALMGQCDTIFPKLAEISGYSSWLVDRYVRYYTCRWLPTTRSTMMS